MDGQRPSLLDQLLSTLCPFRRPDCRLFSLRANCTCARSKENEIAFSSPSLSPVSTRPTLLTIRDSARDNPTRETRALKYGDNAKIESPNRKTKKEKKERNGTERRRRRREKKQPK
jgi:hypothetical protein